MVKKLQMTLLILVAVQSLMIAQRPKPVYDPETREGLLIEHIQQETDPMDKLHFMEQFSVQYPENPAIAWVYDQLQPAYMKERAWDDAMRIGEKRIALEPENLEAAKLSLKAAESKGNHDDILKWADCSWRVASEVAAKGGRNAADAEKTQLYAEFDLYTMAQQTEDPATKLRLFQQLEEKHPKSPYVENIPAECFDLYKRLNQMDKALALADKTLAADPDNIDILLDVSEYHFGRQESYEKIIQTSVHMIEVLEKKQRPEHLSQEDWDKKKAHILGTAYYMGGIASGATGLWSRSDQMLRAALPMIEADERQAVSALYTLGMANYHMADSSPARARDALAYWRRCASIKSSYQAQAMKNVESIRSEFNLP
jgi:tetratricopeptide (TPR) repeat protein